MKKNRAKPSDLVAVILAGGSGSRLWPLSRYLMPKQFIKVLGDKSFMEDTVERLQPLIDDKHIMVVTSADQAFGAGYRVLKPYKVFIEPVGRNTAPAIGLAAAYSRWEGSDPVMIILPSDHVIKNREGFHLALKTAVAAAEKGKIVTLGITPIRPETGYGYIEAAKKAGGSLPKGVLGVKRFVEKPDEATARQYIAKGNFYWNSGMFVFKASVIMEEIKKYLPEVYKLLGQITEKAFTKECVKNDVLSALFPQMPNISIDYGIMEKTSRAALVPCDMGWSDVGSWASFQEISPKDGEGNVLQGDVINKDCKNSLIYSTAHLVAGIGLKDMAVIDTADAVLVCPLNRSQEVKNIVEILKSKKRAQYHEHLTSIRPWGSYTILEQGPAYKLKHIVVNPGQTLSTQMHYHRAEHWVVISGTAAVLKNSEKLMLNSNESVFIPKMTRHSLGNPGKVPLRIIEVQTGEYLEEDDIIRFDDKYGRPPEKAKDS